jgi:serine/threonine protein kinase
LIKLIQVGNATYIWEAISNTDQQRVAIKILREERVDDRGEHVGMRHEFEVGRTLQHENVIRIFELGASRKVPYLVIEFFNAPNLKQWVRQSPEFLQAQLAGIVFQAARGLGHLHEKGWVHRDVKPENLLLNESGQVKVIDFAIAQRMRGGLGRLFAGRQIVQGTRSYMSPEQIRGSGIDQRADIYSLGCTIYHIATGRVPFTGTSANDLLKRHLHGTVPSISADNAGVTPEFNELVLRLMAKRPDDRPRTMNDFLEMLQKVKLWKTDRRTIGQLMA